MKRLTAILRQLPGLADPLRGRRDYAVLVPPGASLPFVPRGPVFWVR